MYLRRYTAADFPAIYALDQVCFTTRFRSSRAVMRRVVTSPDAVVLLACEQEPERMESLLGFCAAEVAKDRDATWAYVSTLDVAPESRGQGVGHALMTAMEGVVHGSGAACVLLHVHVENESAMRLYERLGYQQIGREVAFYGAGFDAWTYRKWLPSDPTIKVS